ncbi:MAG TPA: hypothetical protein VLA29_08330 [Acidimicrobiia bacterium]|nr:hypothetical protein [Acidimicrobiia bacterium]
MDPGRPGGPVIGDDPGRRYVYTDVDPVIGDCHYWSDVPGGLDAWDPANDPAVIAAVTSLPECPAVPGVDPEVRAWEIFRSWDLDPPEPTVTPDAIGITGLATQVSAGPAPTISEDEVLPDGRLLEVRARIISLDVAWGDGTVSSHDPSEATGHPDGSVTHIYHLKTCTPEYRAEHPSGSLCHPSASSYTITIENVWVGEYRVGGVWIPLGTLSRSAELPYQVEEVRGIPAP